MANLDPGQREPELSDALLTLLIAMSRYAGGNKRARPTAARLATMAEVAVRIANGVAERIGKLNGKDAAKEFRRRLAGRNTARKFGERPVVSPERSR